MRESEDQLRSWQAIFPEWLMHAYLNDATTHRIVQECAFAGDSTVQMLLRLGGNLYEERNMWKESALHYAKFSHAAGIN
jgi:hypothetical protein